MDFVRFIFVFLDPVVITLRIEDEWLKMKRRGAESGGSLRWLTFECDFTSGGAALTRPAVNQA